MSRSNPTATNPAQRFMQWKGGAEKITIKGKKDEESQSKYEGGRVVYYDKEAEEEIEVKLPFTFLVLDELNTITGYSEKHHSGFWSNEVRSLRDDKLFVKTKSGTVATGLYENIKDSIKSQGARYAKSVYVAYKNDEGEMELGNIKIVGAALVAWIEFQKKYNVMKCAVTITDEPKLDKKGSNYYFTPVFEALNASEATSAAAIELDSQLQDYLETYMSRKPSAEDDEVVENEEDAPVPEADEPAKETSENNTVDLSDVEF